MIASPDHVSIAVLPIEGISRLGDEPLGKADVRASLADQAKDSQVVGTGNLSVHVPAELAANWVRERDLDHLVLNLTCALLDKRPDGQFRCCVKVGSRFSEQVFFSNFRRAHCFFIPLWQLTDLVGDELITIRVESPAGLDLGPESIPFEVRLFACSKDKIEQSLEERIVFLFSSARSGSTWVASDILGWRHSRRLLDEPGLGQCFAPLRWDAERFFDLPGVPYMESGLDYEFKLKTRSHENQGRLPIAPFARFNAESTGPDGFFNDWYRDEFLRNIRRQLLQHIILEWGILHYQQVCIKMPNESHAADFLLSALPTSRAIHLIRDGRDVLSSRFGTFGSGILARSKDEGLRRHSVAFYSHLWNFQNDIIQSALDRHDVSKRMTVRYEDIRANPAEFVANLFRWLGQQLSGEEIREIVEKSEYRNMPAEEVGYGKRRGDGAIGRYKQIFSESEVELMDTIMAPLLNKYGYDGG